MTAQIDCLKILQESSLDQLTNSFIAITTNKSSQYIYFVFNDIHSPSIFIHATIPSAYHSSRAMQLIMQEQVQEVMSHYTLYTTVLKFDPEWLLCSPFAQG